MIKSIVSAKSTARCCDNVLHLPELHQNCLSVALSSSLKPWSTENHHDQVSSWCEQPKGCINHIVTSSISQFGHVVYTDAPPATSGTVTLISINRAKVHELSTLWLCMSIVVMDNITCLTYFLLDAPAEQNPSLAHQCLKHQLTSCWTKSQCRML